MELPQDVYRFGNVVLDLSNLRLTVSGEVRTLEPKSFRLLQFLVENRHRVVAKEEILSVVWDGVAVSDNALTRAVAQIRKALGDDPKEPRYIETVPTVGYRFLGELDLGVRAALGGIRGSFRLGKADPGIVCTSRNRDSEFRIYYFEPASGQAVPLRFI